MVLFGRSLLWRRAHQAMGLEDVVGRGEPAQHRAGLVGSAQRELAEAPLPEAGVDAFAWAPPLVDGLAMRALHAPVPSGDAGSVLGARGVGGGPVQAA